MTDIRKSMVSKQVVLSQGMIYATVMYDKSDRLRRSCAQRDRQMTDRQTGKQIQMKYLRQ